jgi:tetratricopeptide (TPR) repeat protein
MLDGVAEPSDIGQRVAFHRLKAAIASGLGDDADAANEMQTALALSPADPDLVRGTAVAELQARRSNEAVKLLQRSLPLFPKSPAILTLLGIAQYASGDSRAAIDALQGAIGAEPGFEPAHRCLALIVLESSAAPNQRTIDLLCSWSEVVCSALRLRVARESGDTQMQRAAIGVLERAPQENIVARCELARAYEWAGDLAAARTQMEPCVRLDPSPQNHYRLALIYKKLGQTDLAQHELQLRSQVLQRMSEQTALGLSALQTFKSAP